MELGLNSQSSVRAGTALGLLIILAGCEAEPPSQKSFLTSLSAICGQAFEGKIVSNDAVDDDWRKETIIMHVRDCDTDNVKIPLHVGDNRSRTWIISARDGDRYELRHDHRHEDGSEDALTQYGGFSGEISDLRVEFPADQSTKDLFDREEIPVSKANTWAMEYDASADMFAYEMSRPNRFFRIEFDTSNPVDIPPAAWGSE